MSYDLLFFFPNEPPSLPGPMRGALSSVHVGRPVAIEAEDVYDEIRHLVSGGGFQLTISCSGSREDFDDLERIKTEIIRDNPTVVVIDNQAGTAIVRGQEGRLPRKSPESQSALSIFFEDGLHFEANQFEAFIELIHQHLPQALPRRYGLDEPLRFKTAELGLDHFKSQWRANPRLVWQPHAPFSWAFTNIRNDRREFPDGVARNTAFAQEYRCSRIHIIAKKKLCEDSKLLKRACDFLADAAILVDAFYAEIRADYRQVNDHSWWWKGIPRDPPLIAIVGPPYRALWKRLDAISRPLGAQHRLVSRKIEPTTNSIEIPEELIGPRDKVVVHDGRSFVRPNQEYAQLFPFSRPQ